MLNTLLKVLNIPENDYNITVHTKNYIGFSYNNERYVITKSKSLYKLFHVSKKAKRPTISNSSIEDLLFTIL